MSGVWNTTSPATLLAAGSAADRSLRTAFDADVIASTEFAEAVDAVRRAATVACERPEGRPLFAGHASLPWPDDPVLVMWHAQTLLREYRGDGHIAALTVEGLSGLDALISHAASGDVPADVLRLTRAYSEDEWSAGVEANGRARLGRRHRFVHRCRTSTARAHRDRDRSPGPRPYAALGDERCSALRATGRRLTDLVVAAGLLAVDMGRLTD